jgi:hypothetical protein
MARISAASRRFAIAYILLVGLPLLGLVGVLKAGRRVSAPISVDGGWKLDATVSKPLSGSCSKPLVSLQDSTLTISQSGKNLVLSLNRGSKSMGSGVIDGTAFSGTIPLSNTGTAAADDAGCGSNPWLTLTASVDPKAQPRSMLGTIAVNGCSSCATMTYRAVRQSPVAKGETR